MGYRKNNIVKTLLTQILLFIFVLQVFPVSSAMGEARVSSEIFEQYSREYGIPGIAWNQEILHEFSKDLRDAPDIALAEDALRYIAFHIYEEIDSSNANEYYKPLRLDEAISFAEEITKPLVDNIDEWEPHALCMHTILQRSGQCVWKVVFYHGDERISTAFFAENKQIVEKPSRIDEDAPWYVPFTLDEVIKYDDEALAALHDTSCPQRIVEKMSNDLSECSMTGLLLTDIRCYGDLPIINCELLTIYNMDSTAWPLEALIHIDFFQRILVLNTNPATSLYHSTKSYLGLPQGNELKEEELREIVSECIKQYGYKEIDEMKAYCFKNAFNGETGEMIDTVWAIYVTVDNGSILEIFVDGNTKKEVFNIVGTSDQTVG